MSESKTITIQLSAEDSHLLEGEAKRLNLSPEALASVMLHQRLAQAKSQIKQQYALEALKRLREIGRKQIPIDAVQLARESRQELEQRGMF